mmetsp:Transcript_55985/g.128472  ORF Transcript_55985/g.128472 Transcript_55985/m.128472 type:complete len:140 (+) Transcript_55985:403-822(+)
MRKLRDGGSPKVLCGQYNTATFPLEKYYDLEKWDTMQQIKRAKKTKPEQKQGGFLHFDDEKSRKLEQEKEKQKRKEQEVQKQVARLRGDREKLDEMRHNNELHARMEMLFKAGKVEEAKEIQRRLTEGESRHAKFRDLQ